MHGVREHAGLIIIIGRRQLHMELMEGDFGDQEHISTADASSPFLMKWHYATRSVVLPVDERWVRRRYPGCALSAAFGLSLRTSASPC